MLIRLPIDIKSLYLNIKNDNESGHTATVATPLKQYNSYHEELLPILDIEENINPISRDELVSSILMKSRAEAKIIKVCVFDKIMVNGIHLVNNPSFCIYVREETAPTNVHFGRQKVHYPVTFKYSDAEIDINNKIVMKMISETLHGYAFIIEAFEYDTDSRTLNFDATIVGTNGIPYSKVFINRRGAGNKFRASFTEDSDVYDTEIIAMREKLGYEAVTPDNFFEVQGNNKEIALGLVRNHIEMMGGEQIRNFYEDYPYALYEYGYIKDGVKQYAIVTHTSTTIKYFHLSINRIRFCSDFENQVRIYLVTDVNGDAKIHQYTINELNEMSKSINSISYQDTEA